MKAPPPPGSRWQPLLASTLAIVLAGAAAYANSFDGPFVHDDIPTIIDNPTIRDLSAIDQLLSPPWKSPVYGRPVVNISLAVNYALGGTNVRGFHLFNLVIHILAGLTLFGVVRRTLLVPRLQQQAYPATGLALVIALIWVVHPLQTESVTYIIQRSESMMGLFFLLTLYCVVRGATASRGWPWLGAAVVACALGMGTKEVIVTAPPLILLYDRVFLAQSWREVLRRRWAFYVALPASWIILVSGMTAQSHSPNIHWHSRTHFKWSYTLSQPASILTYLRLSFWPRPLIFDYGNIPLTNIVHLVLQWSSVALLVGATGWALIRRPPIGFLGAWFFVILSPTSSVLYLNQPIYEHRMYVPLAAVITLTVMTGYIMWRWWKRRITRQRASDDGRWRRVLGIAVVGAVVVSLGVTTAARNRDYRTVRGLWEDTAVKRPQNPTPYTRIGIMLMLHGKLDQALQKFNKAISVDSTHALAYGNRGNIYSLLGREDDAMADYTRAIKESRRYPNPLIKRGRIYFKRKQYTEAIRDYSRVIRSRPGHAETYYLRGQAYGASGRCEKAVADYSRAIELNHKVAPSLHNRAVCYFIIKQYDRAWSDVKRARAAGHELPAGFIKELTEASSQTK